MKRILQPLLILIGATMGFVIGGVWGHLWSDPAWGFLTGLITLFGEIFLNTLKMVVIPLIICAMISGVASLGDVRKIGGLAGFTFLYYMLTTFAAIVVGLVLVTTIHPGVGFSINAAADFHREVGPWYESVFAVFRDMFPSNLFAAAANGKVLGLILFSLVFGGVLTTMGERGKRMVEFFQTFNDALLKLVRLIIWAAPIGVLGLVAARLGKAGGGALVWQELIGLGRYFLTVIFGLGIHGLIVLPCLLYFFTRKNPFQYAGHFATALLTAFSTASSAATLPITMRSAEENAGISRKTSGFVLPLGATINMDGTALYEAVAAVFIAQAYGVDLTGIHLFVVLLTATLAAVGAAAIPEAGLVTMVLVLHAVNVPVEGIGLLLSVDWLLDRFRTTVNVWGDSVGAAVLDVKFGEKEHTSE